MSRSSLPTTRLPSDSLPTPRLRTTIQQAAVNTATVRYGTILSGDAASYPSSLFTPLPVNSSRDGNGGLSKGAVAGIAVGAVAGFLLLLFLAFLFVVGARRRRRESRRSKRESGQNLLPTTTSTSTTANPNYPQQGMQHAPNYQTAGAWGAGGGSAPFTASTNTGLGIHGSASASEPRTSAVGSHSAETSQLAHYPTPPKATQPKTSLFFGGFGRRGPEERGDPSSTATRDNGSGHRLSTSSSIIPFLHHHSSPRFSNESSRSSSHRGSTSQGRPRLSGDSFGLAMATPAPVPAPAPAPASAPVPSGVTPVPQGGDRSTYAYNATPETRSEERFHQTRSMMGTPGASMADQD